jgi:hypothetical protein
MEIEALPTTHAAFTRLLTVAVETLHAAGAWVGLAMEDTDALVVVAAHGDVPVEQGARVPRERAFAARALRANSAIFADPSTGVRWNDTMIARVPVRAVAAPLTVDGELAVGVISIIGGPGRLFTVADGALAHELGSLATLVLRRRDRRAPLAPLAPTDASGAANAAFVEPVLLDAAAAVTVDDFATAVIQHLDDPALLGVSIAVRDDAAGMLRFPAAIGALAALRGIRTPLDTERAEPLSRLRRVVQLPDARHLVPEAWRSLVPALPGASIALVDGATAVGRIDIVFDPDRVLPHDATRRIEQQAGTIARALIEGATWESIQAQPYDGTRYPCGCHPHPKEPHLWFHLCDYHDGFDSGVDQGCHELQTENERLRAALRYISSPTVSLRIRMAREALTNGSAGATDVGAQP